MDPSCLAHVLNPEERQFFNANGYLIVENAVEPAANRRLIDALDRVDARERTPELAGKLLSVSNIVHEDDELVELIDNRGRGSLSISSFTRMLSWCQATLQFCTWAFSLGVTSRCEW